MGDRGMRGLALICGAERWDLAVILGGKVVARCTAEGGAAALDARRAEDRARVIYEENGGRYLDTESCRRDRENFRGTLLRPEGEEETAIAGLHAAALTELFAEAAERFADEPGLRHVGKALPLVCGGGAARVPGFAKMAGLIAADAGMPIPVGEATAANGNDYQTCRGALILAEIENAEIRGLRKAA